MRPVIGLVACHSKCSQPIRGGAQEAGKRPVLSAAPERGRREDMEIHIAAVFSIVNHLIYHLSEVITR